MGLAVIGLQASRSDIGIVSLQRDDFSIWLDLAEGLDGGRVQRGSDDVVPFRSGQRPLLRAADTLPIVLRGYVMDTAAAPRTAYRSAMDDLLTIFAESSEALVLLATLEDGSVRWIETWHPNILAPQQEEQPVGIKVVSVEVTALDPYWYGSWGIRALDSGWTLDSGHTLDESTPLVIVPSGLTYDRAIEPPGTADIEHVRVTFSGPSTTAPGISVVETGVGFTMATALAAGSSLVVDNDLRTCLLGGVTARSAMTLAAANLHGEYFRLPPRRCTLRITGAPASVSILAIPAFK
jgi:hypothetical protein